MIRQNGHQMPLALATDSDLGETTDLFTNLAGTSEHNLSTPPAPWICSQPCTNNYMDYHTKTSQSFTGMNIPGGTIVDVRGDTYRCLYASKLADSFVQDDHLNVKPDNTLDVYHYDEALKAMGLCHSALHNSIENPGVAISADHISNLQEANGSSMHVFHSHMEPTGAASHLSTRRLKKSSRQEANAQERNRRSIISKRIQDLQNLLPHPVECGQSSVVDGTIEHIIFLKLQLKELSRTKLGDERFPDPLIFVEGFGHYHFDQMMLSEPLEEIFGLLLQENPPEATKFLEGRGLFLFPMNLLKTVVPNTDV